MRRDRARRASMDSWCRRWSRASRSSSARTRDPLFGPILVVGAGGILVELVKDVACRLLPVGPQEARAMIGELKVAKLLAGFRGRPAADVDALIAAICGLSDFYLDHRHLLSDLEINPLIVLPKGQGVRAVDVRIAAESLAELSGYCLPGGVGG